MSDAQTPNETQLTDEQMASMSDEEFASMDLSFLSQEESEAPEEGAAEEPEETPSDEPQDDTRADDSDDPAAADDEPQDEPEADGAEDDADASDAPADDESDEAGAESDEAEEPSGDEEPESDDGDSDKKSEDDTGEVDYKAEYEKIFAPFKANGREIKVDSADDAISLMQMGANYNKKMASLKPNLKMLKLLENNGLLSEEKLGYLVDLNKKDPEAIKKLVQDSGVDPLEMDLDKKSDYTPSKHEVDDREIELDSVLDKIQDTPTYQKTIQLVQDQWDGESKRAVAERPEVLEVINDHMGNGVYDIISAEVEKQRMLGRLKGLSELEAYKQTGDSIQARGGFDHLFQKEEQPSEERPPKKVAPKPKAKADPKVKSKKRAASSTRTAPSSRPSGDFNPLEMSDAEFEKLVNAKYV